MKALVTKYLNIRTGSPALGPNNNPNDLYYKPGDTIDIVEPCFGETHRGNSIWYKLADASYVWSGGVDREIGFEYDAGRMSKAFNASAGVDVVTMWNKYKSFGSDIRIAVLDSGINTAIKDITDAIANKDLDMKDFTSANSIEDNIGHGTKCAGIIAARGYDCFGVSPKCQLIIGKINDRNDGATLNKTMLALKWACEERNADVISISHTWNKPIDDESPLSEQEQSLNDYMQNMSLKNKFFFSSVGNEGEDLKDFYSFPGNFEGCLSIGMIGLNRLILENSGWNSHLSFVAPGEELFSYGLGKSKILLPAETSFSCPFAAGIAVNILSYLKANGSPVTFKSVTDRLCFDNNPEFNPLQYGKGIINPITTLENQ